MALIISNGMCQDVIANIVNGVPVQSVARARRAAHARRAGAWGSAMLGKRCGTAISHPPPGAVQVGIRLGGPAEQRGRTRKTWLCEKCHVPYAIRSFEDTIVKIRKIKEPKRLEKSNERPMRVLPLVPARGSALRSPPLGAMAASGESCRHRGHAGAALFDAKLPS
jgi:hypothetical protein